MVHIITRDINSVSWAEIWAFSKLQHDIIDVVTIWKIIVFNTICYVACYSVAKFTPPIEQPSNMQYGWSWKQRVKPNLDCCSNIALTISCISVLVSSWQSQDSTELQLFKCQGHPVSLTLTFDLRSWKVWFIEIFFRLLWYSHLLMRHCPCNLLPEPTSPKHEYRRLIWGHLVMSSMTSSTWKILFLA